MIHFTFYINYNIWYHECHTSAVSIYFLEVWDSHLGAQFTDEWMWNYVAWCTTVNLTFHNMFTAFCPHQYRCHPSLLFCFNVHNFLFDNVCWLIAGWLFWIPQLVQLSWCFLLGNLCKVVLLSTLSTSFSPCWASSWQVIILPCLCRDGHMRNENTTLHTRIRVIKKPNQNDDCIM